MIKIARNKVIIPEIIINLWSILLFAQELYYCIPIIPNIIITIVKRTLIMKIIKKNILGKLLTYFVTIIDIKFNIIRTIVI